MSLESTEDKQGLAIDFDSTVAPILTRDELKAIIRHKKFALAFD